MDSHFDEEDNLESQVIFGHLESTVAVRCLARNEMAAVSREIKLVSNGKKTHTQGAKHKHSHTIAETLVSTFPLKPQFNLRFLAFPTPHSATAWGSVSVSECKWGVSGFRGTGVSVAAAVGR